MQRGLGIPCIAKNANECQLLDHMASGSLSALPMHARYVALAPRNLSPSLPTSIPDDWICFSCRCPRASRTLVFSCRSEGRFVRHASELGRVCVTHQILFVLISFYLVTKPFDCFLPGLEISQSCGWRGSASGLSRGSDPNGERSKAYLSKIGCSRGKGPKLSPWSGTK